MTSLDALNERCIHCGLGRLGHVADPPDGYWPECTNFTLPAVIDAAHLTRQRDWSHETFGPGDRTLGVIDHIRKELDEIQAAPEDASEWADVVILAFDGAMRAGIEPQDVLDAVIAKQAKNEAREWPDWRGLPTDRAIEHVR